MSILIPGMSLPKEGENRLALFVGSDGVVDVYRSVGEATPWLEHYVCECDAIELPPHGRLIDADEVRKSIRESVEECAKWANEVKEGEMYARVSQSIGTFVECSLRIKNAHTIIEAEGSGTDV